jgi:hypothetical protein
MQAGGDVEDGRVGGETGGGRELSGSAHQGKDEPWEGTDGVSDKEVGVFFSAFSRA